MKEFGHEVDLTTVCDTITYGYTASATDEDTGVKFLRITDIVPDRINWETVPFCLINEKDVEKYQLNIGDIVVARTGATTGWNKTIKHLNHKAVYASFLIKYSVDRSIADPNYVGYNLQSSNWYDYVEAIAGGSAQPGANAKQLGSFKFLLPPLPEQKAIASVLSSLDDKIDLLHRQNKTLEAMAETLFRQWFIEDTAGKTELITLGEMIEIHDSKRIPLSKLERDKKKNGSIMYPYYGAAKIMDYVDDYIFDGDYLLLGEDGTVQDENGYPILQRANGKFWVNNHAHVLSAKAPYNNFFLWCLLSKTNIEKAVTGAVQPKINQENLRKLDFVKFDESKVLDFNDITSSMLNKLNTNNLQIQTLENLRDTLLPKLMSGEVRVQYQTEEVI